METREQLVHNLQDAEEFEDGEEYTLPAFKAMAERFDAGYPELQYTGASTPSPPEYWSRPSSSRDLGSPSGRLRMAAAVEDAYWRIVEASHPHVRVEYANDQDVRVNGSGFAAPAPEDEAIAGDPARVPVDFADPKYYTVTGWNLRNLARAKGSLLRHMKGQVGGVNVPWLYVGMLFASFAWHTEDNYLYSINYMHHGTAKTWYGIPERAADAFERTVRSHLPDKFTKEPDRIHKLTTVFSPAIVQSSGIPVFHTVQEPGEFIVTFPRGYHSGFSHGFNIAEACNFAVPDWVPMGRRAMRHYEKVARETCFSHDEIVIRAARAPEELDLEACTHVARDLRIIAAEARSDRASFLAMEGVDPSMVIVMSGGEPRYNCAFSGRMCFVSAVVCESALCRSEAAEARNDARKLAEEEVKALLSKGVPREEIDAIVEPDPQHTVVRPRFAENLCDCSPSALRMVVWFDEADLERLASQLDVRRARLEASASTVIPIRARALAARGAAARASASPGDSSRRGLAGAAGAAAPVRSLPATPSRSDPAARSDSPLTAMSSAPAAGRASAELEL